MFQYVVAVGSEEKLNKFFMKNYQDEYDRRQLHLIKDGDGIAKKYNSAIDSIKVIDDDDVFIFGHEDLLLPKNLEEMEDSISKKFSEGKFQVLGVIGSKYNGGDNWYFCDNRFKVGSVKLLGEPMKVLVDTSTETNELKVYDFAQGITEESEVATVDGLIIICTGKVVKQVKFDERLPDYHLYDSSFCLNCRLNGFKISTIKIPDLAHCSTNQFNDKYYNVLAIFNNLYRSYLPDVVVESKNA